MQPQASDPQFPVPAASQPAALPAVNMEQPAPVPLPPASMPAPQQADVSQTAPTALAADDGDLIEKEWVEQVQHIVATTRNDPFEQSKLFTQLKAEYMQKRYGKDLKSDS